MSSGAKTVDTGWVRIAAVFRRLLSGGLGWLLLVALGSAVASARANGVEARPDGVVAAGAPGTLLAGPLGRYAQVLDETPGSPLNLDAARARLAKGAFQLSEVDVTKLGTAGPARWMHLAVDNRGNVPLTYRLYAAEGWVDQLDVWLVGPGGALQHWAAGDERSPGRYLRVGLGFGFDVQLSPGRSSIFLRADSVDDAAMSVRLVPLDRAATLEGETQHWMGLVHGVLLALVTTFGLLWLAARDANHLRYVMFVGACLVVHLAHSGIGAQWAWPEAPSVGRFAFLAGLVLVSCASLSFARSFLGLANCVPLIDRVLLWAVRLALLGMAGCIALNAQLVAVHLAFAINALFTFWMVGLGALAVRIRREQAGIFMAGTLFTMAGTLVTTLSVMGVLPFNLVTSRSVDAGLMLEATLWAMALVMRMRRQRDVGTNEVELSLRDPLTGLHNRRGFLDLALPVFATAARSERPLSAIVIHIDHFKNINDRHGHAGGDETLVDVAERIRGACRTGDIVARWGDAEFVTMLPETDGARALAFAERLRDAFSRSPVQLAQGTRVPFTASFGVAVRHGGMNLDQLLQAANAALHRAKNTGRDRVVRAERSEAV